MRVGGGKVNNESTRGEFDNLITWSLRSRCLISFMLMMVSSGILLAFRKEKMLIIVGRLSARI